MSAAVPVLCCAAVDRRKKAALKSLQAVVRMTGHKTAAAEGESAGLTVLAVARGREGFLHGASGLTKALLFVFCSLL